MDAPPHLSSGVDLKMLIELLKIASGFSGAAVVFLEGYKYEFCHYKYKAMRMLNSWFSRKSGSIDRKFLEMEQIGHSDIETILCNTNLNKVPTADLRTLKRHILLLINIQITPKTFQELAGIISSESPAEVWDILLNCMKKSPSNIQTDSCCQTNLLSTVFSKNELKDLPPSWFTVFLCDMCCIHCNIDPETPETSRILLYMFTKLPNFAPERTNEIAKLYSVIEDGIRKFNSLGTPFWTCLYFGNSRMKWLGTTIYFMTNEEATKAFDCIIRSMQWEQVTETEVQHLKNLRFSERSGLVQASYSFNQHPPSDISHGIQISIDILAFLFERIDDRLLQLPYIYYLIIKTDIQFKVNFHEVYASKDWRHQTAIRLRDFIESPVNREIPSNEFVYAVSALYFIWNRNDGIHFFDRRVEGEKVILNYIRDFSLYTTLLYEGGNLIASMY